MKGVKMANTGYNGFLQKRHIFVIFYFKLSNPLAWQGIKYFNWQNFWQKYNTSKNSKRKAYGWYTHFIYLFVPLYIKGL